MRKFYGEKAAAEPDREFSSTQVNLPPGAADKLLALGRRVSPSDLNDEGRESEPHITVKFGLHDAAPTAKLRHALKGFGPITATLGKTSLFRNPEFDVVKVDVHSNDLHRLNKLIAATCKCTDTHPTYKPHVTVAYVKKNRGDKYAGDDALAGTKLTFDTVVFSAKDRTTKELPLE